MDAVSILLIQAAGPDQPGILEALTCALGERGVRILDIGQSVIHSALNLGLLIELKDDAERNPLLKELLFAGHEVGVSVSFTPISDSDYESWVGRQGETRHIISLFGPCVSPVHLATISRIAREFGLNISHLTRLSGRPSVKSPCATANTCIELSVRGTPTNTSSLRREILTAAQQLGCDIAIQIDDMYRRNRRLICFDMDSTLVQGEGIDELARAHGVVDQVAKITAAAMNGEVDFDESLRRRLRLLKGLKADVLQNIADSIPLTEGAERLVRTVKALGFKTAILSGGFTYFGRHAQRLLGIDYVHANELEIVNGELTGNVVGPIVNGQRKAALLKQIAEQEGIRLEQVIAVGDGANDLPMLNAAGLGIAFHAKPKVKESAEQQISTTGLDGILYLLGVRDREVPDPQH